MITAPQKEPVRVSPVAAPTVDRRPITGLLIAAGCVVGLFFPTFHFLVDRVWLIDANYTHGFLILPISLWLAWRVIGEHPLPRKGEPIRGILWMVMGLLFHLPGVLLGPSATLPIEFVSLLLVLRGLAVLLGGREWADRLVFPSLFLIFLFPLPVTWTTQIAVGLQDIVASISAEVLGWFFLCFRRGNSIFVAGVAEPMVVAKECSGISMMMAFVALGALVAHLGKTGWLRGLLLMALAVPVAIFANVVRVVLMGMGRVYFGPSWISTWMHDFPAWFTIPLGVACFFGLVWLVTPDKAAKEPK